MMVPRILAVLIIVIIIAMAILILILFLRRIALQLLKVGSRGHDDQSGRREYTTHEL